MEYDNRKMIKLNKCVKSKVLKPYFFIEGTVDINGESLIKKVKQGCLSETNLNGKTNIKGNQTAWTYFNDEPEFIDALKQMITCLDKKVSLPSYSLRDSWGFSLGYKGKTEEHTHIPHLWSGVLYLNDHSQTLNFNEIGVKIRPQQGKFALFSAFLKHKCNINKSQKIKWGISFNLSPL